MQYKYVPEEYDVPVHVIKYVAPETNCFNVNGVAVPCHIEGEARRKRSPEEEAAAAPAVAPLVYGGYPFYGHAGFPYAHYAHPLVKYAEPTIKEIPVPTPVVKEIVKEVPLAPLCQNHLGLAVPCRLA